jgi:hypothetical protein
MQYQYFSISKKILPLADENDTCSWKNPSITTSEVYISSHLSEEETLFVCIFQLADNCAYRVDIFS